MPSIILGTIFVCIIMFFISVGLWKFWKWSLEEKGGTEVLAFLATVLYCMAWFGSMKYFVYTFKDLL